MLYYILSAILFVTGCIVLRLGYVRYKLYRSIKMKCDMEVNALPEKVNKRKITELSYSADGLRIKSNLLKEFRYPRINSAITILYNKNRPKQFVLNDKGFYKRYFLSQFLSAFIMLSLSFATFIYFFQN